MNPRNSDGRIVSVLASAIGAAEHAPAMSFTLVMALLAASTLGATTAVAAVRIPPGEVGTLVPPAGGFGISLDIPDPRGVVEIMDLDDAPSTLATATIIFDPSGDGIYEYDLTYRSTDGLLVSFQSLFPELDFVSRLGGAGDSEWGSEHTGVGNTRVIWSFEDGSVYTLDTSNDEVTCNDQSGNSETTIGPPMDLAMLEGPALIVVKNNTPGTIQAATYAFCHADLNGDNIVSPPDLFELLASWGTDPGGPPDFDGGGFGVTDLLYLLGQWGCSAR